MLELDCTEIVAIVPWLVGLIFSPHVFLACRASDKKKNIAAQKAAAQRRLLQPRGTVPDVNEKRASGVDKRKEELVRTSS